MVFDLLVDVLHGLFWPRVSVRLQWMKPIPLVLFFKHFNSRFYPSKRGPEYAAGLWPIASRRLVLYASSLQKQVLVKTAVIWAFLIHL